jgi:hypothetical protein
LNESQKDDLFSKIPPRIDWWYNRYQNRSENLFLHFHTDDFLSLSMNIYELPLWLTSPDHYFAKPIHFKICFTKDYLHTIEIKLSEHII